MELCQEAKTVTKMLGFQRKTILALISRKKEEKKLANSFQASHENAIQVSHDNPHEEPHAIGSWMNIEYW